MAQLVDSKIIEHQGTRNGYSFTLSFKWQV